MTAAIATGNAIDCHAHVAPRAYVELLVRKSAEDATLRHSADWYGGRFAKQLPAACSRFFFGSLRDRVPELDEAGVEYQIISSGSSLSFPVESTSRPELVTAWNEIVHHEVAEADGRFKLLAGLPLPDIGASLNEIERVVGLEHHVGFGLTSHIQGQALDGDQFAPVLERLNELHTSVFLHPDGFRVRGLLERSLNVDVGTQFDDTLASITLYGGLAAKYPAIRWLVPHLGGALPFLMERLDEHWERDRDTRDLKSPPSASLDRIFFDTAGHGPRATAFAAKALGAHRLVLGTDFPMVMADRYPDLVRRTMTALGAESEAWVDAASRTPRELFFSGAVPPPNDPSADDHKGATR